jgi:hypothetical protein
VNGSGSSPPYRPGGGYQPRVSRNQPWATWTRVATGARWTIDNAPPTGPFRHHAVTRAPVDVDDLVVRRRVA